MSYFPVEATCPQCAQAYTFWGGMVGMTMYTDPGFCSLACAQSRLLYLLLHLGDARMKMTRDIYEKIVRGDVLTDAELGCAAAHFADLTERLGVLGPHFQFAFAECNRRADELRGYIRARETIS